MSLASQILLRPRPPRRDVGTAWIPLGLEYFPIHLSHQDPPPELKKEWDLLDFNCSITLDKYLVEYHQKILPLPYLDESVDICTLYVQLRSGAHSEDVEKLVDFRRRTMEEMVGWWRSLPSDAPAKTAVFAGYAALDDQGLAQTLSRLTILPMDNNGLELKSWACMFCEVDEWLVRCWTPYQKRVYECHSELHSMCTAEFRLLYHDTNKLIRSLLGVRGARAKPSPRSSDIPLEDVSNTLPLSSSQQRAARLKIN
ncbi:hypothetical protein B0H16DRAFT_667720 [Mycena metata]|uniref:Uncharacterized protein n=1 Tax=Mycena metata TaxID=1033252 RepID=A0AAD7NEQ9_9AGAR|nr:hypothetical protein B0H16DRAFT_667720 [Mycena metata]